VVAFNVSVAFVFVSVPGQVDYPAGAVDRPQRRVRKGSAQFTVLAALASRCIVPLLDQVVFSVRIPPLIASIVPVL